MAVLVPCLIGATSASAAAFTYRATGEIEGHATLNQVLTTNGGTVSCSKAATRGFIEGTNVTKMTVGVSYSGCMAYGFTTVDIFEAKYLLTANGTVHIVDRSRSHRHCSAPRFAR